MVPRGTTGERSGMMVHRSQFEIEHRTDLVDEPYGTLCLSNGLYSITEGPPSEEHLVYMLTIPKPA